MKKNEQTPKKPMNEHHLKNSRYSENYIPKREKDFEEGHVPDRKNPKRLKELH